MNKRRGSNIEEVNNFNGVYVIRIKGNFDINSTPCMCKDIESEAKVAGKPKAVVLDFADVDKVDTTAFACLISLIKNKIQDSNKIGVFNLDSKQKSLIEILQVHEIINNFQTEEDAVSFFLN